MSNVLLKETIEKSDLRPEYFAAALDISLKTWREKVEGVSEFKVSEVKKLIDVLGLTQAQAYKVFF